MSIERIQEFSETLTKRISQVVLGQEEVLRLMTVSLLAEGHVVSS